MSAFKSLVSALRTVPRGYSADGRRLGLGLDAALDTQRRRGAEPVEAEKKAEAKAEGRRAQVG